MRSHKTILSNCGISILSLCLSLVSLELFIRLTGVGDVTAPPPGHVYTDVDVWHCYDSGKLCHSPRGF
jgi:hypothetical protein